MRRAISWPYCAPKSSTATVCVFCFVLVSSVAFCTVTPFSCVLRRPCIPASLLRVRGLLCAFASAAFALRAFLRLCYCVPLAFCVSCQAHVRTGIFHVSRAACARTSTAILYKLTRHSMRYFCEYAKIPRLFMTVYTAWEIPVHLRTRAHSQCVFRKLPCAVPAMDTNAVSYTC